MKERITAEEAKALMIEHENDFVYGHQCSGCRYPVGYRVLAIEPEVVVFDAGCDCVSYDYVYRPSSFDDIANSYNMQSNDEARASVLNAIKGTDREPKFEPPIFQVIGKEQPTPQDSITGNPGDIVCIDCQQWHKQGSCSRGLNEKIP